MACPERRECGGACQIDEQGAEGQRTLPIRHSLADELTGDDIYDDTGQKAERSDQYDFQCLSVEPRITPGKAKSLTKKLTPIMMHAWLINRRHADRARWHRSTG